MTTLARTARALASVLMLFAAPMAVHGQDSELPVRPFLDTIPLPELAFDPPTVDEYEVAGVTVFHIRDTSLPLVDIGVRFQGGNGTLPRRYYAAAMAMPALLRSGGTREWSADAFDEEVERRAVQLSFGGNGSAITSSLSVLMDELDAALQLWGSVLKRPAFEAEAIEVWRGRELEIVRRREDDPGRLAFAEYNRLMYGDHPIGWEMEPSDLTPERVTPEIFAEVHSRLLCPSRMLMAVTGPPSWNELRPRIEAFLADWPVCGEPVPPTPIPAVRTDPAVWLLPRDLEQATIVVTQAGMVPQGDTRAYFASRIGHAILGASGLSSRLNQRLRTELGYTYGASGVWTTPRRWPGLIGATTQVRPEVAVDALRQTLEVIEGMRTEAPTASEVEAQVEQAVNGWVFNFDSPASILSRRLGFRAAELPDDWLVGYLEGISAVTPDDVRRVFEEKVVPGRWVVLIVGDPERIGEGLEEFGPIRILELDAG